jgi:hypothetical protein
MRKKTVKSKMSEWEKHGLREFNNNNTENEKIRLKEWFKLMNEEKDIENYFKWTRTQRIWVRETNWMIINERNEKNNWEVKWAND